MKNAHCSCNTNDKRQTSIRAFIIGHNSRCQLLIVDSIQLIPYFLTNPINKIIKDLNFANRKMWIKSHTEQAYDLKMNQP